MKGKQVFVLPCSSFGCCVFSGLICRIFLRCQKKKKKHSPPQLHSPSLKLHEEIQHFFIFYPSLIKILVAFSPERLNPHFFLPTDTTHLYHRPLIFSSPFTYCLHNKTRFLAIACCDPSLSYPFSSINLNTLKKKNKPLLSCTINDTLTIEHSTHYTRRHSTSCQDSNATTSHILQTTSSMVYATSPTFFQDLSPVQQSVSRGNIRDKCKTKSNIISYELYLSYIIGTCYYLS